jgi:glycosyltransferase involved in cell wall biosynthesis
MVFEGLREGFSRIDNLETHPFSLVSVPYVRALDFRRKCANICTQLTRQSHFDALIAVGAGVFPYSIFRQIRGLGQTPPLLVYYAFDSMTMEYARTRLSTLSNDFATRLRMWAWYSNLIASDRQSCLTSDVTLASSMDTTSHLIADYGASRDKIELLYAGIPDDFATGAEFADPDRPTFLHVAGGIRKGTEFFLEAMKLLKERYSLTARAIITRASPSQISQIRKLPIDAEAYGWGPHPSIKQLYSSSTALVSPSLSEGFCLPVIEAGSFGKAAVVSNVGSLPELVIDGENGFVVSVTDTAALAERMYQLGSDKRLRNYMGGRARELSQRYKISNVTRVLIDLLTRRIR